jgi:hypothetical protein
MTVSARSLGLLSFGFVLAFTSIAAASPTMVRLGYAQCNVCHLAPEGAGLLTDYGKGIDQAQSLQGGEHELPEDAQNRWFRYDGRLLTTAYSTTSSETGTRPSPPPWLRAYFRDSLALGASHRVAATVRMESPVGDVSQFFQSSPDLNLTATWEYRPRESIVVALVRDRLLRGVELGETRTILQDGSDSDRFPTQLRAFFGTSRLMVTTYAYAPGSSEALDRSTRGLGALAEVPLFANHVVLGASVRRAMSEAIDRNTVGGYVRLGFGKWGVLAEHEVTRRTLATGIDPSPHRYAGYTQLFAAPWEWLVASLIGEQSVERGAPRERVFRWRPELQARLSPNVTITASARNDSTRPADGTARLYLVQVALKTVQ